MSSCVLCSISIVHNCDKNLVDGRKGTTFNVRAEILTLDYRVPINSSYICRSCLALLKKRRALLTSLEEVNSKLHNVVYRSSNNYIVPAGKSPTPQSNPFEGDFRQEQPVKRIALEDLRSGDQRHESQGDVLSRISVDQFPVSAVTSTPCKDKGHPAVPSIPVSPITGREGDETSSGAKKTRVLVTVEWPSRTKDNVLHEGLESLGKMLCRGTYKQIAGAVWRNPILKKHVQQLFLQEVDRECTALCSLKNPSCLRSPKKEDLQSFSFKKFTNELESKAPLFSAVLWTASVRKSKREDEFWVPAVCMSAAVLLKNRSPCMNAMQLLNTIILYHTGIIVSTEISDIITKAIFNNN